MDLYQELGKAVQDNISGKWEKATVKIESSLNKMCSFQAEYTLSSFEKKELKFPLLTFLRCKKPCILNINGTGLFISLKKTDILI